MSLTPSAVCTIILAYSDRAKQLQQVLLKVLEQEIGHVIIVANAVSNETHHLLTDLIKLNEGRLEILISNENIGSAGGYALGLSKAIKEPYDYFWLLDDDNLPLKDSLSALLDAYSIHEGKIRKEELVLQSFRESLPEMLEIVNKKRPHSLPRAASFIGFHVCNLWDDFCSKLFMRKQKDHLVLNHKQKLVRLHSAPYGGLFFHKNAIKILGIPNPLFFLYADDFAYTLNFTLKGGSLLLVPDSRIMDLEPVWNATGGKTSNIHRRLNVLSSEKTYYEVRNRIYLGRTMFPGHRLMYFLNKWVYLTLLGLLALYYRRGKRLKLILRAVSDGEQGRLGKRNFENES